MDSQQQKEEESESDYIIVLSDNNSDTEYRPIPEPNSYVQEPPKLPQIESFSDEFLSRSNMYSQAPLINTGLSNNTTLNQGPSLNTSLNNGNTLNQQSSLNSGLNSNTTLNQRPLLHTGLNNSTTINQRPLLHTGLNNSTTLNQRPILHTGLSNNNSLNQRPILHTGLSSSNALNQTNILHTHSYFNNNYDQHYFNSILSSNNTKYNNNDKRKDSNDNAPQSTFNRYMQQLYSNVLPYNTTKYNNNNKDNTQKQQSVSQTQNNAPEEEENESDYIFPLSPSSSERETKTSHTPTIVQQQQQQTVQKPQIFEVPQKQQTMEELQHDEEQNQEDQFDGPALISENDAQEEEEEIKILDAFGPLNSNDSDDEEDQSDNYHRIYQPVDDNYHRNYQSIDDESQGPSDSVDFIYVSSGSSDEAKQPIVEPTSPIERMETQFEYEPSSTSDFFSDSNVNLDNRIQMYQRLCTQNQYNNYDYYYHKPSPLDEVKDSLKIDYDGILVYIYAGEKNINENYTFRCVCMRFGLTAWDELNSFLPWRTRSDLRLTLLKMLKKQAIGEYSQIRADPKIIGADNLNLNDPNYKKKGGLWVNQKWDKTPEEKKAQKLANQKKYHIPVIEALKIDVPLIISHDYIMENSQTRKANLILYNHALATEYQKRTGERLRSSAGLSQLKVISNRKFKIRKGKIEMKCNYNVDKFVYEIDKF